MNNAFLEKLFKQQKKNEAVPSNEVINKWAMSIICILFPELSLCNYTSAEEIGQQLACLEKELIGLMNATKACYDCNNEAISHSFFEQLPEIQRVLETDVVALHEGDPAANTPFEVVRAYPGFKALSFYRIAHVLHTLQVPLLPRILTEQAHSATGIDIHPGAAIGEYCMIDHGTGIVIGETAKVGRHVKLYQGITLGALSVNKNQHSTKRHPTIEDNVVIYSGATILGGDTIIGEGSVIGGNVWLTSSVPAGSLVFHDPEITVVEGKYNKTQ